MEDQNESKVLKSRVQTLEKELYIVIKELDHYRNKCKKLRLKLLQSKTIPINDHSEITPQPVIHPKNSIFNKKKLTEELGPQIGIQKTLPVKELKTSDGKTKETRQRSSSDDGAGPKTKTKTKPKTEKKVNIKAPQKAIIKESPSIQETSASSPVLPQKRQLLPESQSSQCSPVLNISSNISESVKKLKAFSESEEGEILEGKLKKTFEKIPARAKKNSVQKVMENIRLNENVTKNPPDDLSLFSLISKRTENETINEKEPIKKTSAIQKNTLVLPGQSPKQMINKKCKPAYNTRYTMEPAFEPTYTTFKANPIQMTPTTISLSQLTPIGQKIKENFELIKKLYQTCYDFNYDNVFIISQDFKTLDPSTAASFLVSEMMQLVYIFSAFDALAVLYGVVKDVLKKNSWDLEFLKAIRNFFVNKVEDVWFVNCPNKLPSLGILVSSMNDVIHGSFVLNCKENNYLILIAKMLAKLVLYKNTRLITQTFSILGESVKDYYSLWIFQRFYINQENHLKIMQELVEKSFTHDENLQMNIYLSFKSILRHLDPKDAYNVYVQILWPIIKDPRESFGRVLVLKLMTVLYLIFEKEKKKKTIDDIKKKLEDVLTDKEFKSKKYSDFNKKEIEVVQKGLIKITNSCRSAG